MLLPRQRLRWFLCMMEFNAISMPNTLKWPHLISLLCWVEYLLKCARLRLTHCVRVIRWRASSVLLLFGSGMLNSCESGFERGGKTELLQTEANTNHSVCRWVGVLEKSKPSGFVRVTVRSLAPNSLTSTSPPASGTTLKNVLLIFEGTCQVNCAAVKLFLVRKDCHILKECHS